MTCLTMAPDMMRGITSSIPGFSHEGCHGVFVVKAGKGRENGRKCMTMAWGMYQLGSHFVNGSMEYSSLQDNDVT